MSQREERGRTVIPDDQDLLATELARDLLEGEPLQILDVRAPERVARERIEEIPPHRFHNLRGSEVMQITDVGLTGLDPETQVVVVCGHGKDSKVVAAHLRRMGLSARSLAGGMAAWLRLTVPVELDPPEGVDRVVQFDRIGKGCLGYLLLHSGEALIVDPPLFCESYIQEMEASGAALVGVLDTHIHADYVSGAASLAMRYGVPYYLHPLDAVYPYDGTPGAIPFRSIADGDVLPFGGAVLRIMHTPGHTEGSVTLLVENRMALTGDFLFVESIGRPDLGGKEEEWAGQLWSSVVRVIREWEDGMAVYPAHYAGQGERRLGNAVGLPFGTLRRENELLRIQDSDVFVRTILGRKAPFPDAYRRIKAINLGLHPVVATEVEELEVGRNECALGGS